MPSKFRLSLLARFELTGPDGPIGLANKKLAGLLAYLACTAPVSQPRKKLETLLWGSHFDTQARQNLRQALFRLRRALGPDALMSDGNEVWLAPGVIDCDVTRLKALSGDGSRASLAAAADLYQDPLLADVNIAEDAWADWLTLAAGEDLPGTDPGAIIVRHELPDGRVYGSTSVSLVALAKDGRLRYDFQPAPPDPATWYSVDISEK